jgi:hypothetical protein
VRQEVRVAGAEAAIPGRRAGRSATSCSSRKPVGRRMAAGWRTCHHSCGCGARVQGSALGCVPESPFSVECRRARVCERQCGSVRAPHPTGSYWVKVEAGQGRTVCSGRQGAGTRRPLRHTGLGQPVRTGARARLGVVVAIQVGQFRRRRRGVPRAARLEVWRRCRADTIAESLRSAAHLEQVSCRFVQHQ